MSKNIDDREERWEIVRYRMDEVVFVWFVVWDRGFGYFRVSSSYNLHLNLIISRFKLETLTNVKAILQLGNISFEGTVPVDFPLRTLIFAK